MEGYIPFSIDLLIRTNRGWLIICFADLKIRLGKEYKPFALFNGVFIISLSICNGLTGLKRDEPGSLKSGRYSENCLGGLGILEARLCPIDKKCLFMIFGNSEELYEIRSFPRHLSEVIFLRTFCFRPKRSFMPSHVFLMLVQNTCERKSFC